MSLRLWVQAALLAAYLAAVLRQFALYLLRGRT